MVCGNKGKLGAGHRLEGTEARDCYLGLPSEQVYPDVRSQVPEGRSSCPDQDLDELCHHSR